MLKRAAQVIPLCNRFPRSTSVLSVRCISSIVVSEEVREALSTQRHAVVALETAVVTHGLPRPTNFEVTRDMMRIIRKNDCVPALIGIRKGRIHVGLSEEELAELASNNEKQKQMKVAKRDIGYCVSEGLDGGTTVSATAYIAASAGITMFATGGIGGVHRLAEQTFDVSSDLVELGRLPVCVVCAGCKSILDIAKTLEYLETQSVQVATFGTQRHFPAFFLPRSDFLAPVALPDELQAARLCHVTFDKLKHSSGVLIAVPIPLKREDNTQALAELIEKQLQVALNELRQAEAPIGKDVTPFLLRRLAQLTDNATVTLNVALLKNNADLAARIARQWQKLRVSEDLRSREDYNYERDTSYGTRWTEAGQIRNTITATQNTNSSKDVDKKGGKSETGRLIVVGGALHETTVTVRDNLQLRDALENRLPSKSLTGTIRTSVGGVGRNVADCAAKLGVRCSMLTAIEAGERGEQVLKRTSAHLINVNADATQNLESASASYVSVVDQHGNVLFGVNDSKLCDLVSPQFVQQNEYLFDYGDVAMVCVDANVPLATLNQVLFMCHERRIPLWFEPTSVNKATKWLSSTIMQGIESQPPLTFLSPNYEELLTLSSALGYKADGSKSPTKELLISSSIAMCELFFQHVPSSIVFVKLAQLGVVVVGRNNDVFNGTAYFSSFSQKSLPTKIMNVTGAGDCFVAGVISGLLQRRSLEHSVHIGLKCSWHSLQDMHAVPTLDVSTFTDEALQAWKASAQIEQLKI